MNSIRQHLHRAHPIRGRGGAGGGAARAGGVARLWAFAIVEHAAGRPAESDAALHELIAQHAIEAAYQVAKVYGARGDADLAFDR